QRVAVVGRVRHEIGGDIAAGAAAVLDDELLAELLAERLRQHARGDVARGARTEADDDAYRPRRIALRFGDPNGERGSAGRELQKSTTRKCHGVSLAERGGTMATRIVRQSRHSMRRSQTRRCWNRVSAASAAARASPTRGSSATPR